MNADKKATHVVQNPLSAFIGGKNAWLPSRRRIAGIVDFAAVPAAPANPLNCAKAASFVAALRPR
jgi:hypothetical protein